jgi:hypothetical protein
MAEVILTVSLPDQEHLEVPMPRRRRPTAGVESYVELARKLEILERELAVQRNAIEKLKMMGRPAKPATEMAAGPVRKSA